MSKFIVLKKVADGSYAPVGPTTGDLDDLVSAENVASGYAERYKEDAFAIFERRSVTTAARSARPQLSLTKTACRPARQQRWPTR